MAEPKTNETPPKPTIHVVHFAGSINPVTTERIRDSCLRALSQGAAEIRLHLSTDGGGTFAGFGLYNFLRSLPVPLTIHNVGNIESIGIVVFMAGRTRIACPYSRFLVHPLTWGFSAGSVEHSRLREYLASLDNDLDRYAQLFHEATQGAKEPLDIRTHLSSKEKIIAALDATAHGIVDRVEEATIPHGAANWWPSCVV